MSRGKIKKSGLTELEETVLEMVVVGLRLAMAGVSYPPTQRDMMDWLGYGRAGDPCRAIARLQKKGFIRRAGYRSRAIEVLRVLDGGIIPGAGESQGDISSPSGPNEGGSR